MRQDVLLQISNKLREVRKEKGITQQEVADDAAITKSMLSQIENGRSVPSLLVLMRLINALGIDLNAFFKDIDMYVAEEKVIVRRKEDYQPFEKEFTPGFHYQRILTAEWDTCHIDVVLLTILPGATRSPVITDAYELKYVIQGTVNYNISGKCYQLRPGDSLFFDGNEDHAPANEGEVPAVMLVVYFFKA